MKYLRALAAVAIAIACEGANVPSIPVFAALSPADAQARAIGRNLGVQQAVAAVDERVANLRLARIQGVPHFAGDYTLAPQAGSGAQSATTVEQHFIAAGASLSVNDLLATSDAVRAAAGDLLAAQRQADAATLLARENALRLYFSALRSTELERLRTEVLASAIRDRNAAAIRVRAGESPRLDVMRADVAVQQARADLALAQAERVDAVEALASATGVSSVSLGALANVPSPPQPVLDENADVGRALASRPEIAALLASVQARRADVGLARTSGLPTITANAGYQRGVDTGQEVRGPQASVHLDVPLAPQSPARVAIARAHVSAVEAQLIDARRTIALEVGAAVRDARAADASERAALAARDVAARALAAVELGYREGSSSSLDISDARRTYVQTSVDAVVAEYARAQAYALLEVLVP
ncbi:MAG TPA: TolC family protein [Candidatus Tyrphobacter sp.]